MIKYIIFDWGGVFTHGHLIKDFAKNLSEKCGKSKEEIEKEFRVAEYLYEKGRIVPESFWKNFRDKLDVELTKEETQKIFLNSYILNSPMLYLAKMLREKYILVLLTNSYEDMFDFIKLKYGLEEYFDYLFSSSDIKDKKPNKGIYRFVIKKLKINLGEAIFIDDKKINITGARETGLYGIKFEGIDKLVKTLRKDYGIS
jgi:glucose-1-phosphatase